MGKITSYARNQIHGVSDPLSGATVAPSNDHTDGSWNITDIYDRELMINTGSGLLQYRAGNDIYSVQSTLTPAIKTVTQQIGNWDMSTAGATNSVTVALGASYGNKIIVGMDAILIPDPTSTLYTNGNRGFPYNHTQYANSADTPLQFTITDISIMEFTLTIQTGGISGTNVFRWYSDGVDASFASGAVNRGYVMISYLEP
jgi:hypothetical protein